MESTAVDAHGDPAGVWVGDVHEMLVEGCQGAIVGVCGRTGTERPALCVGDRNARGDC